MAKDKQLKLDAEISVQVQNVEQIVKSLDSALRDIARVNIFSEENLRNTGKYIDEMTASVLRMINEINSLLKNALSLKIDISGVEEGSIEKFRRAIEGAFKEALSKVREDIGNIINNLAGDFSGLRPAMDSLFKEMGASLSANLSEPLKNAVKLAEQAEKKTKSSGDKKLVKSRSGWGTGVNDNPEESLEKRIFETGAQVKSAISILNKDFRTGLLDISTEIEAGLQNIGNSLKGGSRIVTKALTEDVLSQQAELLNMLRFLKDVSDKSGKDFKVPDMLAPLIRSSEHFLTLIEGHRKQVKMLETANNRVRATYTATAAQMKNLGESMATITHAITEGTIAAIIRPYDHIGKKIQETLKFLVITAGELNNDLNKNIDEIARKSRALDSLTELADRTRVDPKLSEEDKQKKLSGIESEQSTLARDISTLKEFNNAIELKIQLIEKDITILDHQKSALKAVSDELKVLERLNKGEIRTFERSINRGRDLVSRSLASSSQFQNLSNRSQSYGGLLDSSKDMAQIEKVLRDLQIYRKNLDAEIYKVRQGESEQIARLRKSFEQRTGEFSPSLTEGMSDSELESILNQRIEQYQAVAQNAISDMSAAARQIDQILNSSQAEGLRAQLDTAKDLEKNNVVLNELNTSLDVLKNKYVEVSGATISGTDSLKLAVSQISNLDKEQQKIAKSSFDLQSNLTHLWDTSKYGAEKYGEQAVEALKINEKINSMAESSFIISGPEGDQFLVTKQRVEELVAILDQSEKQYEKNERAVVSIAARYEDLDRVAKKSGETDEHTIELQKRLRNEIASSISELIKAEAGFNHLEKSGISLSKSQRENRDSISAMISELTEYKEAIDKSVSANSRLQQSDKTFKTLSKDLNFISEEMERFRNASIKSSEDIVKMAPAFDKNSKALQSVRDKLVKAREEAAIMVSEGVKGSDELYNKYNRLVKITDDLVDSSSKGSTSGSSPISFMDIARYSKDLEAVDQGLFKFGGRIGSIKGDLSTYQAQLKGTSQEKNVAANAILKLGSETQTASGKIAQMIGTLEQVRASTGSLSVEDEKKLAKLKELKSSYDTVSHSIEQQRHKLERVRKDTRDVTKGFADYSAQLSDSIIGNFRFIQSASIIGSVVMGLRNAFRELLAESKAFARTLTVMRSDSMTLAQIYEQVRDTIRSTAIEFGQSTNDVLEVVKQFGSAGLSTEESLKGLKSAMQLVITTQAGAESVTRSLAGIYNVFGQDIAQASGAGREFATIVDVMTSAYRNHQIELDEMTQGLRFAAATGRLAGFSFQEISAFLAVLNDNLIKSGTAGRGLQVVFAQLAAKTDQIAQSLDFRLDPNLTVQEQFIALLEKTNSLIGEGKISVERLDSQFKIFGLRGARSFATLAQNVDSVKKTLVELNDEAKGVSDQLTNIVKSEVYHEWEVARQALLEIGRDALEPMKEIIIEVTKWIRAFSDMLKDTGLGRFANIVGFTSFAIMFLITGVMGVTRVFNGLTASIVKFFAPALAATANIKAIGLASTWAGVQAINFSESISKATARSVLLTKTLGLLRVALLWVGGPIGLVITSLGLLATYMWRTRDSSHAIDRSLSEIVSTLRELDDNSKRLKTFEKDMEILSKRFREGSIDATIFGQKVRNAFQQAGDSVISSNILAGKSNRDIAQSYNEIEKSIRLVTKARSEQLELQKKEEQSKILDEISKRIVVATNDLKKVRGLDFSTLLDENFQAVNKQQEKAIKDFKNSYYEALVDMTEVTGDMSKSHNILSRAILDSENSASSFMKAMNKFGIRIARPFNNAPKSLELVNQKFRETSDALNKIGLTAVNVEDRVDALASSGDRLFELSSALSLPIGEGLFDDMLESSRLLIDNTKSIQSSIASVYTEAGRAVVSANVGIPFKIGVFAPVEIDSSALTDFSNQISSMFQGKEADAVAKILKQRLEEVGVNVQEIVAGASNSTMELGRLIDQYIRIISVSNDLEDGTETLSFNYSNVLETFLKFAQVAGSTEKEMKNLVNSSGELLKNSQATSESQRYLNKFAESYVNSIKSAVDAKATLNPMISKRIELEALTEKNLAREITSTKDLTHMSERLVELYKEQSMARSAGADATDADKEKLEDVNKSIQELSSAYKDGLESITSQLMMNREIQNQFKKNRQEAARLNKVYAQAAQFSKSEIAQQVNIMSLKRREIKDEIDMLRATDMLNGKYHERLEALNKIKQMKIDNLQLIEDMESKWHSQNQTILETLNIFEEIDAVGKDFSNQVFKIMGYANNLTRIKGKLLMIDEKALAISTKGVASAEEFKKIEAEKIKLVSEFAKEYQSLIAIQQDLVSSLEKATNKFEDIMKKILGFSKTLRGEAVSASQEVKALLMDIFSQRGIDIDLARELARAFQRGLGDYGQLFRDLISPSDIERISAINKMFERVEMGGGSLNHITNTQIRSAFETLGKLGQEASASVVNSLEWMQKSLGEIYSDFSKELAKGPNKDLEELNKLSDKYQSILGEMSSLEYEGMDKGIRRDIVESISKARETEREILRSLLQSSGDQVTLRTEILIKNQSEVEMALRAFEDMAKNLRDYLAEITINPRFLQDLDKMPNLRNDYAEDMFREVLYTHVKDMDKTFNTYLGSGSPLINALKSMGLQGYKKGGQIKGYKNGGHIPGYGGGDKVPAFLEQGEYIIPKGVVSKFGSEYFDYLLAGGGIPGYQDGGAVSTVVNASAGFLKDVGSENFAIKQLRALDRMYVKLVDINAVSESQNVKLEKIYTSSKTENAAPSVQDGNKILDSIQPSSIANASALIVELKEYFKKLSASSDPDKANRERNIEFGKRMLDFEEDVMKIMSKFKKQVAALNKAFVVMSAGVDLSIGVINSFGDVLSSTIESIAQAASTNVQAIEQYRAQLKQIELQYDSQIKSLQDGLRRNSSSYWEYISAIEDAERQRFEQALENERQLKEQLVQTGKIVSDVFSKQVQSTFSAISGGTSSFFGQSELTKEVVDSTGKRSIEKTREGSGVRGLLGIEDTSRQLEGLYGSLWALGVGAGEGSTALGFLGKSLGSFSLDLVEMTSSLAMQGLQGILGPLMDPEQADVFTDQLVSFLEDFPAMAPEFIDGLINNLDRIINALVDALPAVISTLAEHLPRIINMLIIVLANELPKIIFMIIEELPGMLMKIIPVLIVALGVLAINLIIGLINLIPGLPNIGYLSMPDNMETYHKGGMIGGKGEVPIMALGGEAVLSRQGVKAIGGSSVIDEFNRGRNMFLEYQRSQNDGLNMSSSGLNASTMISTSPKNLASGPVSNEINLGGITVNGKVSKREAEDIGRDVLREIDKGLKKMKDDRRSQFDK